MSSVRYLPTKDLTRLPFSPAMEASVSVHMWGVEKIVALID